ncbi:hypothetical protein CGCVW01_v000601, partial [Colletotrichum viniferum]
KQGVFIGSNSKKSALPPRAVDQGTPSPGRLPSQLTGKSARSTRCPGGQFLVVGSLTPTYDRCNPGLIIQPRLLRPAKICPAETRQSPSIPPGVHSSLSTIALHSRTAG